MWNREKHCRWCSKLYISAKPPDRDGFCGKVCKQAHYRAYKNYVTAKSGPAGTAVTLKKRKAKKSIDEKN